VAALQQGTGISRLKECIDYWRDNIEGELHSVKVCRLSSMRLGRIRRRPRTFTLH